MMIKNTAIYGLQAGSVMGSSAGGAHAAIKQQKARLASLIARLRAQRQACQVSITARLHALQASVLLAWHICS